MTKRHPSLVPIARDHVQSLSIAVRLQRGPKGEADRWPSEPALQAAEIRTFFEAHMRQHFAIEEELMIPAARRYLVDGDALASRLLAEHREIERLILALQNTTAINPDELVAIGVLLEAHVRFEDRKLFPLMEAEIPEQALAELGLQVDARYAS